MTINKDEAIKTWPEHIWLQWNPDELEEYPGASEDLTWCEDNIYASDVEYVRADLAATSHIAPDAAAIQAEGVRPDAEAIQWRNIQKVVNELAAFCFNSGSDPQWGVAYTALVTSLTAKDGLQVKLDPLTTSEPMARFCPGCGSVGTVEAKYRDCCPDGDKARLIPKALAEQCHDLFRAALAHLSPAIAPEASELPPLPEEHYEAYGKRLYDAGHMQDFARAAIAMHQAAAGQHLINTGALRQFCHNDGSEGFVFAYDKEITDRIFASLAAAEPVPTSDEAVGWFVETKHADGSATISTVRPGISDSFQLYRRAPKPAASYKELFLDWWLTDMDNSEFFNRTAKLLGIVNEDMDRPLPPGRNPPAPASQSASEAVGVPSYDMLPRYYMEGVENGGYYLATDVIRMLSLAAPAAPTDATSFEAAMRKHYPLFPMERQAQRHGDNEVKYVSAGTQHAWTGWQLYALKSSPQAPKTEGSD